jgi:hypothetical protein
MKPLEKAFNLGQRAFLKGIFASPYGESSFLNKEWKRGFDKKFIETQKLLESKNQCQTQALNI